MKNERINEMIKRTLKIDNNKNFHLLCFHEKLGGSYFIVTRNFY